jgi:hypothetical protein
VSVLPVWGCELVGFNVEQVGALEVELVGDTSTVVVPVPWSVVAAIRFEKKTKEG